MSSVFFFFNDTATTEIYTLSLHDALPISLQAVREAGRRAIEAGVEERRREPLRRLARSEKCEGAHVQDLAAARRSEEHTSELQSRLHLVFRLLLEKHKGCRHRSLIDGAIC